MSTNTMTDSDELLAISIPMLDNPKPADLRSIYISNIPLTATREQIYSAIARAVGTWGDLEDIRIPYHRESGRTYGHAYAIFKKVITVSGITLPDAGPPSDEPLNISMPIVDKPKPAEVRSVYIGYIPLSATREQIYSAVERAVGPWREDLVDVRIPTHLETGRTLGYAYAIFKKDMGVDCSA
jgi:hypothetical protein